MPLRAFCKGSIAYEEFCIFSANPDLIDTGVVSELTATVETQRGVALYVLSKSLSVYVLNGTSQEHRMKNGLSNFHEF